MQVGTIFQIENADRVYIDCGGPAKTKCYQLSGVAAPRMGIVGATSGTNDDPYAWESREFLRNNYLNQRVQFRVVQRKADAKGPPPPTGKFPDLVEIRFNGKDVAAELVAKGLARASSRSDIPVSKEVQDAATEAQRQRLGVHSADASLHVRSQKNVAAPDFDADAWFKEMKGQQRKCIVENLRDCGTYRIVMLPEGGETDYVTVQVSLSGVEAPKMKYGPDGEPQNIHENAIDARHWMGMRIMNRELSVRLENMSRSARGDLTFVGSFLHPAKGSIAEFLLEEGFVQCVNWSANMSVSGLAKLTKAQEIAQRQKKRRWRNFDPSKVGADTFEFTGTVVEICNTDVFKIIDLNATKKEEMRYYLASIRAPRMAPGEKKPTQKNSWAPEGVEYMRKLMIGKTVKVKGEYSKNISIFKKEDGSGVAPPASNEKTGDMYFVTVKDDKGRNVAELGLKQGLVELENPIGEAPRSCEYDALRVAADAAKEEKVGIWSEKFGDYMSNYQELIASVGKGGGPSKKEVVTRAKGFEGSLKGKELDGTVTFIMNGSRCRIKIPSQRLLVNFQISGIRSPAAERIGAPKPQDGDRKSAAFPPAEPFGNESLAYAREELMQREVKISLERVDPGGTFIGQLYTVKPGGTPGNYKRGADYAAALLERGLAHNDGWNQLNSTQRQAEEKAKSEKRGLWSLEQEEEETLNAGPFSGKVVYTNALDDFYLVQNNADVLVDREIAKASTGPNSIASWEVVTEPRRKQMYLGKTNAGPQYYRCKFEGRSQGVSSGYFLDFGMNDNIVEFKKIPQGSPLLKLPAAATKCGLYGIVGSTEFWEAGCEAWFNATNGKTIKGTAEPNPQGGLKVVAFTPDGACAQEMLLSRGFARLTRKEAKPVGADYKKWTSLEQDARKKMLNMWSRGDAEVSEDDEY